MCSTQQQMTLVGVEKFLWSLFSVEITEPLCICRVYPPLFFCRNIFSDLIKKILNELKRKQKHLQHTQRKLFVHNSRWFVCFLLKRCNIFSLDNNNNNDIVYEGCLYICNFTAIFYSHILMMMVKYDDGLWKIKMCTFFAFELHHQQVWDESMESV